MNYEEQFARDKHIQFVGLKTATYCSKCKENQSIEYKHIEENNDATYFAIVCCVVCKKIEMYHYEIKNDDVLIPNKKYGERVPLSMISSIETFKIKEKKVEIIYSYPHSSEINTDDISDNIVKSYIEGVKCLEANAPNGSASMFRRSLQQICVEHGADPKKHLVEQIEILPKEIKDFANVLRLGGNLASHENKHNKMDVSNEDAKLLKKLLERIFTNMYQQPAEMKRLANKIK